MGKLVKFLKLSDPYPSLWYELFCYIKAFLGTFFLILAILLIFHPLFYRISLFGFMETGFSPTGLKVVRFFNSVIYPKGYLGFLAWGIISFFLSAYFFWKIKLVRKVLKTCL